MRACDGFRVPGLEAVERQCLIVARQVALQPAPGVSPFQVGSLLLEVQQRPQLEAGVGDGQVDSIVPSLLAGIRQVGMLIDVENTPDLVKTEEVVSPASRFPVRCPFSLCSPFNEGFGYTTLIIDLHFDQRVPECRPEVAEITCFRDTSLADDQNSAPRFPLRCTPTDFL
jgi:hypothetical protein